KKDAGDMGSGHSVTALYEVIPAGMISDVDLRITDSLRYQQGHSEPIQARDETAPAREMMFVKVRYKTPTGETSREITHPVLAQNTRAPSADFRFQTAVAEFGLLLRRSAFRGSSDFGDVLSTARGALGPDPDGYRAEFVRLVLAARMLSAPLDERDAGR